MSLPFHLEQPIGAPPGVVWRYLLEFQNTRRWMEGTSDVAALDPGPIAVGSRFRQTRSIHGRVATVEFVVSELDEATRTIALEVDGRKSALGRGVFRFRYAMQPSGAATRVVVDGSIDELGRAVELVASLFVGKFVKVVARDLEALRRALEADLGAAGTGIAAPAAAPATITTSSTSRAPST